MERLNLKHLNEVEVKYQKSRTLININQSLFLKRRDSHVKQNHFTDSYRGDNYNRYNLSLRVCFLFGSSDHDE